MLSFLDWMFSNYFLTLGGVAFICGAAVFYLVMQRTRKRRRDQYRGRHNN